MLSAPLARALVMLGVAASAPAQASVFGGQEFPQGQASFADAVFSYTPGTPAPTAPHQVASLALGAPNYNGNNECSSGPPCSFVSLGNGGSIVLRFVDNKLTGSGSSAFDLWIFEVGPIVEATNVAVSVDGTAWLNVGTVSGSTAGIDLDAWGYGTSHQFGYVMLTDVPELNPGGATVGADIDAVGAISTVLTIPEPESYALLIAGLGLLGFVARRRKTGGMQ